MYEIEESTNFSFTSYGWYMGSVFSGVRIKKNRVIETAPKTVMNPTVIKSLFLNNFKINLFSGMQKYNRFIF